MADLQQAEAFEALLGRLYASDWVVFARRPFADAEALVGYVGRYTHRVALSNRRLVSFDGHEVAFRYKDYRAAIGKGPAPERVLRLGVEEFLRRFLLHVLPRGLMRIRYYGLLANRGRRRRLGACRVLLAEAFEAARAALAQETDEADVCAAWRRYPACGRGAMVVRWHWPRGCGPPPAWPRYRANEWISRAA